MGASAEMVGIKGIEPGIAHPPEGGHHGSRQLAQHRGLSAGYNKIYKSKKHGHGVSVSSNDSKALGIWSSYPAKGQFVCIEPWWSVADTIDSDQDFKHKYYTNVLKQSTEFNASFDIKVF